MRVMVSQHDVDENGKRYLLQDYEDLVKAVERHRATFTLNRKADFGTELYEVYPDDQIKLIDTNYDTSG